MIEASYTFQMHLFSMEFCSLFVEIKICLLLVDAIVSRSRQTFYAINNKIET